jgi:hypothetical protein
VPATKAIPAVHSRTSRTGMKYGKTILEVVSVYGDGIARIYRDAERSP